MPTMIWSCEQCGKKTEAGSKIPVGWCEVTIFNGVRFIRHPFCSYACAAKWCSNRYEVEPQEVNHG